MALSGLDIYKLLPKTNCRECGFVTCLAFAMQLAKKAVSIDKCPYLSAESKRILAESSLPSVKLITIGEGENKLEIGNETVMFRHEEKFHHPCGLGFIIEDSLSDSRIKEALDKINKLKFERVGQKLDVNLIAVKQTQGRERFVHVAEMVSRESRLGIVLMSSDLSSQKDALEKVGKKKALVYAATSKDNLKGFIEAASGHDASLVISRADLDELADLSREANKLGCSEMVLDTGNKTIREKIWDLTQIRRQALKKSNRALGYPVLTIVEKSDPYQEAMEAATYISKYAGIVLIKGIDSYEVLSLLTVRQNIYTDPQKPLQIEPKVYPIGSVTDKSPVLVTTNFSLSYYTVLGEVEASKVPSYIVSVDTEGMSVLTAWAAEKFTPEKISNSLVKFGLKDTVSHNRLIIPGYVAVMSGDLEEQSGWEIVVGPKEAAGIPSFLKNL